MGFLILIMVTLAWALTRTLKFEYSSSLVAFIIALAVFCDESRLFLAIFLAIVAVQTKRLWDEYHAAGRQ